MTLRPAAQLALRDDGRVTIRPGPGAEVGAPLGEDPPRPVGNCQHPERHLVGPAIAGGADDPRDTGWDPAADRGAGWEGVPEPPGYQPVLPVTFGKFLTPLDVRVLEERDPSGRELYVLLADFVYRSALLSGQLLIVKRGVVIDGESIPKEARSLSGDDSLKGGAGHDDWYGTHWIDDRDLADRVYREILLTDGVHVVDADKKYGAVAFYGGPSWATGPKRRRVVAVA